MEEYYSKEFRYLNRNVINTVYNGTFDLKRNINTRFASKKLSLLEITDINLQHTNLPIHITG